MPRSISFVAARKNLGRIVEEIGRTGNPVNLTRRGKVVARIVPGERGGAGDPFVPCEVRRSSRERSAL